MTKGFIDEGFARGAAETISWARGRRNGGGGEGAPEPPGDEGRGPFVGKTQAAIAKGASGGVNFWTGTKGSEQDSGVTVQAYNRFADLPAGAWVLFDIIDGGYEIIAALPC